MKVKIGLALAATCLLGIFGPSALILAAPPAAALVAAATGADPGLLLAEALEQRFPQVSEDSLEAPAGIIVLGGGLHHYVVAQRYAAPQGPGERVEAAIRLAKRFPQATLVYAGATEAALELRGPVPALLQAGISRDRIILETASRTTAENAAFTRNLVHPEPGGRWLLVTSAYHMPRAIASFRAVGFDVEAFPVDYLTDARLRATMHGDPRDERTKLAVREYLGLLGYRISGRTEELFPAP